LIIQSCASFFFLLSRSWFGIKPEAKGNVISIGSVG